MYKFTFPDIYVLLNLSLMTTFRLIQDDDGPVCVGWHSATQTKQTVALVTHTQCVQEKRFGHFPKAVDVITVSRPAQVI